MKKQEDKIKRQRQQQVVVPHPDDHGRGDAAHAESGDAAGLPKTTATRTIRISRKAIPTALPLLAPATFPTGKTKGRSTRKATRGNRGATES